MPRQEIRHTAVVRKPTFQQSGSGARHIDALRDTQTR
jgi:hypothetical protein